MFYKNSMSISRGTILIDFLVALSLSTVFLLLITKTSEDSRDIFELAKDKANKIKQYSDNEEIISNLNPDDSISYGTSSYSAAFLYGNWMRQIDSYISSSSLFFGQIKLKNNLDLFDAIGTPFCSVDYTDHSVVGRRDLVNIQNQISSTTAPIVISLQDQGINNLTDLEVRNSTAYISSDTASAGDPDIIVVDISQDNQLSILSSLNTGPGISSIVLAKNRLYGATPSTVGQLHIVRLNSPNNLILENKYRLQLPYATATPALGSAIFFKNNRVYLGTEKWDGDEFNIIDVNDPLNPFKIGGFEIDSKVNDILVENGLAYVSASNHNQLIVIDVNNPNNPILLQTFTPSGYERQEGKVISLFENILDFGRTSGGFDLPNDHEIFSFASTSFPDLNNHSSLNILGGVYGIIRDRKNIYLATRKVDEEIQAYNSTSSNLTETFSLGIAPQTMTCDRNKIYILAK